MRTSELARNAGAIGLGLLISGAIVFGQVGGKWSMATAAAGVDDQNTELSLPRAAVPAGPHLAPAGCPAEDSASAHDPECGPAEPEAPELMQTQ